jgi:hypothetical protein
MIHVHPEDGDIMLLRNGGNYLLKYIELHSRIYVPGLAVTKKRKE